MADYQSVLTRAVAKLPGANSADLRRAIYDRAREAMLTHLRGLHPRPRPFSRLNHLTVPIFMVRPPVVNSQYAQM